MSKIFHIPKGVRHKTHAHPLGRERWFGSHQPLLLKMLTTPYGRDLLCVDQGLPPIDQISHRHVRCIIDERPGRIRSWIPAMQGWGSVPGVDRTYLSEFRIGEKYGNIIRFRWEAYLAYAAYLEAQQYDYHRARASAIGVPLIAGGAVTTVYPDPHPESATVDGRIVNALAGQETWADARNNASGTGVNHDSASAFVVVGRASDNNPRCDRGITLFDTSSIDDGETKVSATWSPWVTAKANNHTNGARDIGFVQNTIATNTTLVVGDYSAITLDTPDEGATRITLANITTGQYNDFALNSTGLGWVSLTGVTKVGWRYSWDIDNLDPTPQADGQAGITVSFAETTGTSNDPKLAVTHTPPFIPKALVY
jgi:hypothetical protein